MTELDSSLICPSCHARLSGKPKFCMRCGAKLNYKAISHEADNAGSKQRGEINLKQTLKPVLSFPSISSFHTAAGAAPSNTAGERSSRSDYWEPQRMKAFIFSIASAIGILLTALGLWYTVSLKPAVYAIARVETLQFMLFGLLIVIGSLFFMTMMEVRSNHS